MGTQDLIAGPRRARSVHTTTPPPLPTVIAPAPDATIELSPQDVEIVTPSAPEPAPKRGSRRMHWFGIGLVLGTIVACLATEDLGAKIRSARAHVASSIRSMKHRGAHESAPASVATTLAATTGDVPCTEEDCALLLAPFKAASFASAPGAAIPLVDVNDLPKAKPRVIYVPPKLDDLASTANTSDPSDDPPPPAPSDDAPKNDGSPKSDPTIYENGPVASMPAAP